MLRIPSTNPFQSDYKWYVYIFISLGQFVLRSCSQDPAASSAVRFRRSAVFSGDFKWRYGWWQPEIREQLTSWGWYGKIPPWFTRFYIVKCPIICRVSASFQVVGLGISEPPKVWHPSQQRLKNSALHGPSPHHLHKGLRQKGGIRQIFYHRMRPLKATRKWIFDIYIYLYYIPHEDQIHVLWYIST